MISSKTPPGPFGTVDRFGEVRLTEEGKQRAEAYLRRFPNPASVVSRTRFSRHLALAIAKFGEEEVQQVARLAVIRGMAFHDPEKGSETTFLTWRIIGAVSRLNSRRAGEPARLESIEFMFHEDGESFGFDPEDFSSDPWAFDIESWRKILSFLTPLRRKVLSLRYVAGLTQPEVAKRLGMKRPAVHMVEVAAKKFLREHMEQALRDAANAGVAS